MLCEPRIIPAGKETPFEENFITDILLGMQTLRHAGISLRLVSDGSWLGEWLFIYSSTLTFRYCVLNFIYWQFSRSTSDSQSISDHYYCLLYDTINNCCTSRIVIRGDGTFAPDEKSNHRSLLLYDRLQYLYSDYCRSVAEVCHPADPYDRSRLKVG